MLRDYQIEICERVREAFARHRSVMVQMPTGTGKTVVLAELVREYLNGNLNVNGGRNVLIVAHRRELVEQIQQALLRVMFRSLASKKGLVTENFLPHPSSPARRGSTSLLNPPILRREDLKPGRLGLYEQTSFNFVDFRLRSAEHSSELDALLSLARKFAPKGVARGYRRNKVAIV